MAQHSITAKEISSIFNGDIRLAKSCGFELNDSKTFEDSDTVVSEIHAKPSDVGGAGAGTASGGAGGGADGGAGGAGDTKKYDDMKFMEHLGYSSNCTVIGDCANTTVDKEQEELVKLLCDSDELSFSKSLFYPRNFKALMNQRITDDVVISQLKHLYNFSLCVKEVKYLTLWPKKLSSLLRNYSTGNQCLFLYNGLIIIDIIKNDKTFSNKIFHDYVNVVRTCYIDDIEIAKNTYDKSALCHDLNKYAFIPFFKDGKIFLQCPPVIGFENYGYISLSEFFQNILS